MKIQVSEHIQERCKTDPEFALLVTNPKKSLESCFRYINRKAMEWLKEDAKARGEELHGECGGDVPDDIVFDWSIEYFKLTDLQEDDDKPKSAPKVEATKSLDKDVKKKVKDTNKEDEKKKGDSAPGIMAPTETAKKPETRKKDVPVLETSQLSLFG